MLCQEDTKTLIVGDFYEGSLAHSVAVRIKEEGARLAIAHTNNDHVDNLATNINAELLVPLDIHANGELFRVANELRRTWGQVDACVHTAGSMPLEDVNARLVDMSRIGFAQAMDVGVHSFIRLVREVEPLMADGGTCIKIDSSLDNVTQVEFGSSEFVRDALEVATHLMATELTPKLIGVHSILKQTTSVRSTTLAYEPSAPSAAKWSTVCTSGHPVLCRTRVCDFVAFLISAKATADIAGNIHYVRQDLPVMQPCSL